MSKSSRKFCLITSGVKSQHICESSLSQDPFTFYRGKIKSILSSFTTAWLMNWNISDGNGKWEQLKRSSESLFLASQTFTPHSASVKPSESHRLVTSFNDSSLFYVTVYCTSWMWLKYQLLDFLTTLMPSASNNSEIDETYEFHEFPLNSTVI